MIKLRHKQTNGEKVVPAKYFFQLNISLEDYEIIEWKDVVRVYSDRSNPISRGIMSKGEAKRFIDSHTNSYFIDVPRPDLKPSSIPTNKPIPKITVLYTATIKPLISKVWKILKNDYIKLTIIAETLVVCSNDAQLHDFLNDH